MGLTAGTNTAEFSPQELVDHAYAPIIRTLEFKAKDEFVSGSDDPNIWKKGNLWKLVSTLEGLGLPNILPTIFNEKKAAGLLPGTAAQEDFDARLYQLLASFSANDVTEGQDTKLTAREASPLTPWKSVAQGWVLLNSLDIPGVVPQAYEASRLSYDFKSEDAALAIRTALVIEMTNVNKSDPGRTTAVELAVAANLKFANRDKAKADVHRQLEEVARIRMDNANAFKAGKGADHPIVKGMIQAAETDAALYLIASHSVDDVYATIDKIDPKLLDERVVRHQQRFSELQDKDLADSLAFEKAAQDFLKDGTPIPDELRNSIWQKPWQFSPEARLVFRYLPSRGERKYLMPDGKPYTGAQD